MDLSAQAGEHQGTDQYQKHYTYLDLLQFQNTQAYSSIGKMVLSNRQTEPAFSFGSASREKQEKVFQNKEMSKTQYIGRQTPGPKYDVRGSDRFYFREPPKYSTTTAVRNTLDTKAKYAYYGRHDTDFEPLEADKVRRARSASIRIGLESRFPFDPRALNQTPGPEYNPGFRPEAPSDPKYTFGFRRELPGQSPLAPISSTPKIVGPGRYFQNGVPNPSTIPNPPKVGFTKQRRFLELTHNPQKNQTYDISSSIGFQIRSKKPTMPKIGFSKAKREVRTGIFKQHMSTQPTRIRIPHPKF